MSNANAPFGFKPIKSNSGGQHLMIDYFRVASSASRIGKGDLVNLASGLVTRETGSTAVGPWLGVAMIDSGVLTGPINQFPVCIDPDAVYEVQGSTAAIAQTVAGKIYKADCHVAPDSNTGLSKDVLTNTQATASNGVRVLRISNRPDNSSGASAVLEVVLNAIIGKSGTAGV